MDDARHATPYERFALVLSIFALVLLGLSASGQLDAESSRLLNLGDLAVGVGLFGTLSGVAASWFTQVEK